MKSVLLDQRLINTVQLLSDGLSHDGTQLGHSLNMTRSGVWKIIQKLKNYGIAIHAIKGKGYALLEPLILLNPAYIKQHLNFGSSFENAFHLDIFENIVSTNDYFKNVYLPYGYRVCLAEYQKKGRGRLLRDWYSPFGKNIYFSCLYFFHKDISELGGLSLVVSLAVVKTLVLYNLSQSLWVKWPNDIICLGKKLSGILVELQAEANGISRAIIGIGMNVNMLQDKNQPISQPWTSLRELVGYYIDRNVLCVNLIQNVILYLQKFEERGLLPFLHEWDMLDGMKDQYIILKSFVSTIKGQVKGINENGCLLLKLDDGMIQTFSSGEVEKVLKS